MRPRSSHLLPRGECECFEKSSLVSSFGLECLLAEEAKPSSAKETRMRFTVECGFRSRRAYVRMDRETEARLASDFCIMMIFQDPRP